MAIKKLQNNFTTPEQSKRLLELGVPADSADCVYLGDYADIWVLKDCKYSGISQEKPLKPIPCWSVGRLIEIIGICDEWFDYCDLVDADDITGGIVDFIEGAVRTNYIDFSRLEEPEV